MVFSQYKSGSILTAAVVFLGFLLWISGFDAMTPVVQGESRPVELQPAQHTERPAEQGSGITPSSGPPGTRITVRGSGFRSFDTVESISLGGLDILGNRTVNTDTDGQFEASDLVVPGLDPGIVPLTVRVGTGNLQTTTVGTFEVTAGPAQVGNALPAAEALAPLGDALERVFYFDNATKTWSFYDPRPEFAAANTLGQIAEGQIYFIKVTRSTTATLNGTPRELTCANEGAPQEDCWNLVVW